MNATASVTFIFDGTRDGFDQVYTMLCGDTRDVALDIGTFYEGTLGTIEFMVDDYATFEKKVAANSAKIGISLASVNFLASEERA